MGRLRIGTRRALVLAASGLLVLTSCTGNESDDRAGAAEGSAATTPDTTVPSANSLTRQQVDTALADLDGIVEEVMDETGIPGVAVSVVFGDEVVRESGYGVRSTETDEPVEADTVFQIASMSKPLSATVMAGLVGEGVIEWDDPLIAHSSDVALSDPWVTDHVTFADLFAHRSGIPGGAAGNDLESVGYDRATILERLRSVPLDPFRDTYSYSNFGMTLAGEVAAEAAGTTWEDAAEDVLFGPAGMTSTSARHADFVAAEDRAELHVERDGEWRPLFERQPDAQSPAGGVSSNAPDLARWMRLVLATGSLDGEQLIDADALTETHTPHVIRSPLAPDPWSPGQYYGLGWNVTTDPDGQTAWGHSGAFSLGAATTVKLLPALDIGITVLTNGAPIGAAEAIADAFLERVRTGSVETDWVELWGERYAGLYGVAQDWSTPPGTAPARPDAAYVGTYVNDYVGEVEVRVASGGGLEIVEGPNAMAFPLDHWDGDEFLYVHDPELPAYPSTVVFEVEGDTARAVTIGAFDGAGLGTLTRR